MSNELGLGKLITTPQEKDAIHIAVLPCIAGVDDLRPGDEVAFIYGSTELVKGKNSVYCHGDEKPFGIVDPFLKFDNGKWSLAKGDKFWVWLFPGTITGLRHDWTHPALHPKKVTNESENWLRTFADSWNFDYDTMIAEASGSPGGYVVAQGMDLHSRGEIGSDHELFWHHLSRLTGKKFSDDHIEEFGWSCSC